MFPFRKNRSRHVGQAVKHFNNVEWAKPKTKAASKFAPFFKILFSVILIVLLGSALLFWPKQNNFPVEKIKIVANYEHITPKALQGVVSSYVQNGFFDLDMIGLQHKLRQMPWVYAVSVQRKWPNTIEINVVEQDAKARWKDISLLNSYGQLFYPDNGVLPSNLPILFGPDTEAQRIFQDYQIMQKTLTDLKFKILRLDLVVPNSWHITFDNGLNLYLNDESYLEQLQNFVKVYPKIARTKPNGKIRVVDLRYSHGMAVKWE
jgi:cell division protein FtsQ